MNKKINYDDYEDKSEYFMDKMMTEGATMIDLLRFLDKYSDFKIASLANQLVITDNKGNGRVKIGGDKWKK